MPSRVLRMLSLATVVAIAASSGARADVISFADFSTSASDAEITGFVRAVGEVARQIGAEETGYRLLANMGPDSHQEVPHLHVHVFAGRPLGPMLVR